MFAIKVFRQRCSRGTAKAPAAGLSPRRPLPGDPRLTEPSAHLFELKQFAGAWGCAGSLLIRKHIASRRRGVRGAQPCLPAGVSPAPAAPRPPLHPPGLLAPPSAAGKAKLCPCPHHVGSSLKEQANFCPGFARAQRCREQGASALSSHRNAKGVSALPQVA